MLNFGRFDSILRNNSRKTSHKWFILSTFLAQCAITYVNFQEVYLRFGDRGGEGCAKIHPNCIYKFQASCLSHSGTYMQI